MASDQEIDSASYFKLVKLLTAMWNGLDDAKGIAKIMEQEGDINYKVPNVGLLKSRGSDVVGCTILHLSYPHSYSKNMLFFNQLLSHGADITMKNSKGQTVLHEAMDRISGSNGRLSELRHDTFVEPVLSAHLKFQISANPVDARGLSHLHAACMVDNVEVIEFFLNSGVSVEQSANADSPVFAGHAPLHFAARFVCSRAVELLLARGANARARDAKGMTPLHAIVDRSVRVSKMLNLGRRSDPKLEDCVEVIERLAKNDEDLDAQGHFGLSRLHVLCTLKDSARLERHLNDIEDVDRAVNSDSPVCPGFTPLHFAALFNIDSLKLLLAKGADITIGDAEQITPLDLCIARYDIEDVHGILTRSACRDIALANGRTRLTDLVISMRHPSHFRTLLRELGDANASIPVESPLWPGYTPLHLAVVFQEGCGNDENKRKMLDESIEDCLKNGADVSAKGVLDRTPLQFAFRRGRARVVDLMLSYHLGMSNPVDEDGLSHLHIACAAKKTSVVETLLRHGADVNLKLGTSTVEWSVERTSKGRSSTFTSISRVFFCGGSTPLHIAVATGNREMARLLLERGADPQARDSNGMSAVHRLMTSHASNALSGELLSSSALRDCAADGCGLSHLHVACFKGHSEAVRRMLLEPGGARLDRAVSCGTAPRAGESLYETYVDRYGDPSAVLVPFDGYTPLHMAVDSPNNSEIVEMLVQSGAGVLAGSVVAGFVPLYSALTSHYYGGIFLGVLRRDVAVRRRVERASGLTDLHLACYERDLTRIGELLADGATDVNARIRADSPFWPGRTPLHALMESRAMIDEPDAALQLLLDNGADVAVSDGRYTPLHLTDERSYCCASRKKERFQCRTSEWLLYSYCDIETLPEISFDSASLMLRSIKDFTSNPTNDQGVSHFHIACERHDVAAVEGFLKHGGVDVNARVDYFSEIYAGYTPLHVTLSRKARSPRIMRIVKLLLKHGADVHAESYSGNTPLHYAAMYIPIVGQLIFNMIFDAGANVNAKNVRGESPLEILLSKKTIKIRIMNYLIGRGCRINDFNCATDEGLIPAIFAMHMRDSGVEKVSKWLLNLPNIIDADESGRTVVHNIVSTYSPTLSERDYSDLIEQLEKLGCDVDRQDNSGQTALHVAARFQNDRSVRALLEAGADINIVDLTGKTAFGYSLDSRRVYNEVYDAFEYLFNEDAIGAFATHVRKLQLADLYVSASNELSQGNALGKHCRYISMMDKRCFRAQLDRVDNAKVGSQPTTLREFVSENGAVWKYSKMRRMPRGNAIELFDTILRGKNGEKLGELKCLVELQYRSFLARSSLIETAKLALNMLAGIPVPDLCSEAILALCENWELRSVIVASS